MIAFNILLMASIVYYFHITDSTLKSEIMDIGKETQKSLLKIEQTNKIE